MEIKSVAFFGSSTVLPTDPHFEAARSVAQEVGRSGRRVVTGGGPGVMLAATLGAKEGGGSTTVVYFKPELASVRESKAAASYADEQFEEANYVLRTKKLLELGNAYIVFNGGTGTLSEFAMAWGVNRLYFGHHKPLLLYGTFWRDLMKDFRKYMLVRPQEYEVFSIVNSPLEVVETLEMYEKVLAQNRHDHLSCGGAECSLLL